LVPFAIEFKEGLGKTGGGNAWNLGIFGSVGAVEKPIKNYFFCSLYFYYFTA
jgi:hypothetical protein